MKSAPQGVSIYSSTESFAGQHLPAMSEVWELLDGYIGPCRAIRTRSLKLARVNLGTSGRKQKRNYAPYRGDTEGARCPEDCINHYHAGTLFVLLSRQRIGPRIHHRVSHESDSSAPTMAARDFLSIDLIRVDIREDLFPFTDTKSDERDCATRKSSARRTRVAFSRHIR